MKLRETVRGGEGADDEEERRVIMAEGVNSGGPSEDVEVVVGELGVVVEFGFEEVEECKHYVIGWNARQVEGGGEAF